MRQKDLDIVDKWCSMTQERAHTDAESNTTVAIERHSKGTPHMESCRCPVCARDMPMVDITTSYRNSHESVYWIAFPADFPKPRYRCLGCLGLFDVRAACLVPTEEAKKEAK